MADSDAFVTWADEKMLQKAWSPDVVVQFAKDHELFDAAIIPCTTTLYHWIDSGIMKTKNMDLLEKLTRKTKETQKKARRNKRVLGESIENRPTSVDSRESFGHWEIDTVIGHKKQSEAALLTLVERQTRFEVILKIEGKKASAVDDALMALQQRAGDAFPHLFKAITSDNGSEFSGLNDTLSDVTDIYFAHPYASWERGISENQHKLIRRFIPKGQSINGLSDEQCRRIQTWMNDYPRKKLGYQTPHEAFVKAYNKENKQRNSENVS